MIRSPLVNNSWPCKFRPRKKQKIETKPKRKEESLLFFGYVVWVVAMAGMLISSSDGVNLHKALCCCCMVARESARRREYCRCAVALRKKKNAVVCCCRWKSSSSADKSGAAFWLSLAGHRGAKQPIHLISSREFFPLAHRGGLRRRLLVFFFFFLFYRGFIQPLTHTLPNAHKKHNRNIVSCLAAL